MKKLLSLMLALFAAIPALLLVWGFALPAQYRDTFVGELPAKRALLRAESDKPRLILVGGSAVAFGVDSALLAKELPQYRPVNFGLYAALGTRVMLDLSVNELRPGDIVVVMPEQQRQALSDDLGAETLWQAIDGDFTALSCLHARDIGPMLGQFPRFAGAKLRYFVSGSPEPEGVYRRNSFNAMGDVISPLCAANSMPDGWDTAMPILFEEDMLEQDFCTDLNEYTAKAREKGAVVYYHFPPMNRAAAQNTENLDSYAAVLQQKITAPLAGNPHSCLMDSGWFYDTNFHLNTAGKTVFTRQLIRDIKAVLGDTTPTEIALPAMPAPAYESEAFTADNRDAEYFTYQGTDTLTLTGLTEQGRGQIKLTVPAEINGCPVTALTADTFAGANRLQSITIQQNITALPDGLFAQNPALTAVYLQQTDPTRLHAGTELLRGAPEACVICVPADSYTAYCLDYTWAPYAAHLRKNETE